MFSKNYKIFLSFSLLCWISLQTMAQGGTVSGVVKNPSGEPLHNVSITIQRTGIGSPTDAEGRYQLHNVPAGTQRIQASCVGCEPYRADIVIKDGTHTTHDIAINLLDDALDEVVVTGTMREVSRLNSAIPVEVFRPAFFKKNPTPSLFDAIGMINGVQPQLNCNVCNTGDIHINGMEGPYTMILIDGMPIVSALSSVYGLSGIPNSLVERIEVVKGPASSLYGSEAMGGIINVITKNPQTAPLFMADVFGSSWGEVSADLGMKFRAGNATSLLGVNHFNYSNPIDNNNDGFTDLTLQNRTSIFNKWNFNRPENRIGSLAARYVYEDRWGGEMNWNRSFRGGDEVYGESVYTQRAELIGMYQLPTTENIMAQFSYNWHDQNSMYGDMPYNAKQQVAFGQMYWDKQFNGGHNLLLGASFRYTYYDDDTPATMDEAGQFNAASHTPLPGLFIQDEWEFNPKNTLLLGYRFDYDKNHGGVHSPRIAYKLSPNTNNTLRASFGTGFRVVNLFTEDHAALTGARKVEILSELNPERSFNGNLNYVYQLSTSSVHMNIDATAFYSYFTNKIIADLDTDPNKIIYDNLDGHAISQGLSLNTDFTFQFPLKLMVGASYMDVYSMEDEGEASLSKNIQLHAPKWSGNFAASYTFPKGWTTDFTGQWNGPMRLPILPNDFRPEYSPWFCIANIQVTKKMNNGLEIYGGVKNLLDFVPKNPIMRPFDPFDRDVDDPVNNPHGYTFDPEYNYSSLQGVRGFLGVRYSLF